MVATPYFREVKTATSLAYFARSTTIKLTLVIVEHPRISTTAGSLPPDLFQNRR